MTICILYMLYVLVKVMLFQYNDKIYGYSSHDKMGNDEQSIDKKYE